VSGLQQQQPPQLSGNNITNWARKIVQYLSRTRSVLVQRTGDESAAEDGIVLFDRVLQAPVISIGGEFKEFTVEGGYKEGTWSPTGGSGVAISTVSEAKYVRIGSLVYATCFISASCADANRFIIDGLPYNASNYAPAFSYYPSTGSGYTSYGTSNPSLGTVVSNSNQMEFAFVSSPTFSNNSIMIYTHYMTSDA